MTIINETFTNEQLRDIVDGAMLTQLQDKIMARELLANREAQPVAWQYRYAAHGRVGEWKTVEAELHCNMFPEYERRPIFTAPPAPAVPGYISTRQATANMERHELCGSINVAYKHGWNDFRAAMLAQPQIEPQNIPNNISDGWKLVPVEPTEEMIAAAMNFDDVEFNSDETFCVNFDNIYRAMLAAAPERGNNE